MNAYQKLFKKHREPDVHLIPGQIWKIRNPSPWEDYHYFLLISVEHVVQQISEHHQMKSEHTKLMIYWFDQNGSCAPKINSWCPGTTPASITKSFEHYDLVFDPTCNHK